MKLLGIRAVCVALAALALAGPVSACTDVRDWLSVCTDSSQWEAVVDKDGETLFRNVDNYKAQVLVYKGGIADGATVEDAARSSANSDAKSSQDYKALARGEMPSGNIVFTSYAKRNDVDYIYASTLSMGARETLRITTWRRGTEATEADRLAHRAFGKLIKVEGSR